MQDSLCLRPSFDLCLEQFIPSLIQSNNYILSHYIDLLTIIITSLDSRYLIKYP